MLRLSHDARCCLVRASEAVSIERRCSRAVQLMMDVLAAAEHAAEAWEAAVSALSKPAAAVALGAPVGQLRLSHRMPRLRNPLRG